MAGEGTNPRPLDAEAGDKATQELAADMHRHLLLSLDAPLKDATFDERFADYQQQYPYLLFGQLAMSLADVELPPNATSPDRARGVTEALRRIMSRPNLFEKVTGTPFTAEFANRAKELHTVQLSQRSDEAQRLFALQQEIRNAGYLERAMFSENQLVRLVFDVPAGTVTRGKYFKKTEHIPAATAELKVLSVEKEWTIQTFKSKKFNSDIASYYIWKGYVSERTVSEPTFQIISLATSNGREIYPVDKRYGGLSKAAGEVRDLGNLSIHSALQLASYHVETKELVDKPPSKVLISERLSYPTSLRQAYLGDTDEFPLFVE